MSDALDRLYAADDLERFLGVPPGGHRDPSPGQAMPRWQDTTRIEQQLFAKRLAETAEGESQGTDFVNMDTLEITLKDPTESIRAQNNRYIKAMLPPPDNAQQ